MKREGWLVRLRLLLTFLLLYSGASPAFFSNVIVFGDSLSDGGNFPESSQIWWHPSAEKTLNNTVAQLYVPFANPVYTDKSHQQWPPLDARYLADQAPISGYAAARRYRSISWPQFFLMDAVNAKLTVSPYISPSILLGEKPIPAHFSFNYAWGYATSTTHCVNPFYQPITTCNANSIRAARKNYVADPNKENYEKLQIPGMPEQVKLFLEDERTHKVSVDQHTQYIFWIGGNDLIIASNALLKNNNPLPALQFLLGDTATHIIHSVRYLLKQLPDNKRPKSIEAMELFNPGLTPGFYHTKLAGIGNFSAGRFNFWLHLDVWFFNLFSKTKIVIIPTYALYQHAASEAIFKKELGETCQLRGGDYTHPTSIPKDNCAGFMFWNVVHPATTMNERVGKLMLNGAQAVA